MIQFFIFIISLFYYFREKKRKMSSGLRKFELIDQQSKKPLLLDSMQISISIVGFIAGLEKQKQTNINMTFCSFFF